MSDQISQPKESSARIQLPVLPADASTNISRPQLSSLQREAENGDVIFRFRLAPLKNGEEQTLDEFYLEQVRELLKLVRFYCRGKAVLIDAFAFRNKPEEKISIITATDYGRTNNR
jgi:hypothetical protein